MQKRYEVAKQVARAAGKLALEHLNAMKAGQLDVEVKGLQDFVTHADRDVESFIKRELSAHFPEDGYWGEESGRLQGSNGLTWVIDPIDGTANFIRAIDQWGISIALVSKDHIELGLIHDPMRDSLYHCQRTKGAMQNDMPMASLAQADSRPADALILIGQSRRIAFDVYLNALQYLQDNEIEHRRFGSAALGLAQVAQGLVDAYFEADLNPWDCLAGLLLIEECGGLLVSGQQMLKDLKNCPVAAGKACLQKDLQHLVQISGS
ncbi:MAG: inositol monophosphatase [Cohaesibacter sp.]|nr:inositol monophosphatase [Cohaesibacter sp.]MCV6601136.1 inositol monophosphatase [Cohaesibacter sp.]